MFKKLFIEFKDFASKGEVISLAIGVVIGSAFKGIIDSLVNDIIMPPISFLTSKVDFSKLYVSLNGSSYENIAQAREASAPVLAYGNFINQVIIFLITAITIFLFVYKLQSLVKGKKKDGTIKIDTKNCSYCDMKISIKATKCPYCTSKI